MEKVISSITINSKEEFEEILLSLSELYNQSKVQLRKIPSDFNLTAYYFVKSHRSSVTEGNTTSVGEFTQLVKKRFENDEEFMIPKKINDETLEIDNLKKVYEFLQRKPISRKSLQSAHSIIGKDILKNNLVAERGKLKRNINYVPFFYEEVRYIKYFSHPDKVKSQLENFFQIFNSYQVHSDSEIFAKFIILQLELISIHPFSDGNGRVSRALAESFIEHFGFLPYTPYSVDYKYFYQNVMALYSVLATESLLNAYLFFADYVLGVYQDNVHELLSSVSKLENKLNIRFD